MLLADVVQLALVLQLAARLEDPGPDHVAAARGGDAARGVAAAVAPQPNSEGRERIRTPDRSVRAFAMAGELAIGDPICDPRLAQANRRPRRDRRAVTRAFPSRTGRARCHGRRDGRRSPAGAGRTERPSEAARSTPRWATRRRATPTRCFAGTWPALSAGRGTLSRRKPTADASTSRSRQACCAR